MPSMPPASASEKLTIAPLHVQRSVWTCAVDSENSQFSATELRLFGGLFFRHFFSDTSPCPFRFLAGS